MGCPNHTCTGYELTTNLNLDTNGNLQADAGDTYWNGGAGWLPIFGQVNFVTFEGIFEGNGHVISNLFINRSGGRAGLFGHVTGATTIRNVGLVNVDITATGGDVGALVGFAQTQSGGIPKVSTSYATGNVEGTAQVGGLVGSNQGAVIASYADVAVTGNSTNNGGLVGHLGTAGSITASYALWAR